MKVSGTVLLFALFRYISHSFLGHCCLLQRSLAEEVEKKRGKMSKARREEEKRQREKARVPEHKETGMGIPGPIIGPIKHLPRRVAPRTSWQTLPAFIFLSFRC